MVTTRRSSAAKPDEEKLALRSKPVVGDDLRLRGKRPRDNKKRRSLRSSGPMEDSDGTEDRMQSVGYTDDDVDPDCTAEVDLSVPQHELHKDFVAFESDHDSRTLQTPPRKLMPPTDACEKEKKKPVGEDSRMGNGSSESDDMNGARNSLHYKGKFSNPSRASSTTNKPMMNFHKRFPSEEPATLLTLIEMEPDPAAGTDASLILDPSIENNCSSDNDAPEVIDSKDSSSLAVVPVSVPCKRKRKAKSMLVTQPSDAPGPSLQAENGDDADQLAVPEVKAPEGLSLQNLPRTEPEEIARSFLPLEKKHEQTNERSLSNRVAGPNLVQYQPTSGPLVAGSAHKLLKLSTNKRPKDTVKDGVIYRPLQQTTFDIDDSTKQRQGFHLPPKSNPGNRRLKKQVMGRKRVQRLWGGRVDFLRTS